VNIYYLDTCIWRDHYENRKGHRGRPLGSIATAVFMKLIKNKNFIVVSRLIIEELERAYGEQEVHDMFRLLRMMNMLKVIPIVKEYVQEAKELSQKRKVSWADSLHAVLARTSGAVLVTQNIKDFAVFQDFLLVKRPEELLRLQPFSRKSL
jgi:predicted nucleic acid-binding protein